MYDKTSPVLDVVGRGGGQLPPDVRADMEAGLGADFSDVRIHTDKWAAASAEAVRAAAYTVGNDIVFGTGSYSSDTDEGRRVLAHELVHVQQQRSGPVSGTDTGSGVAVSDPGDSFEREAESTASRLISYRPPSAVPGAASRYAPGTAGGHRLLAHELGHVVQQSSGQGPAQGRTRPMLQRKPVEGTEHPTDSITELINEGVGLVGSAVEMLAPVAISGSVGRGGKNHQRDVLVVSRRLGQLGYPVGSDPDSFIAAIEKYQAEVVGLDPPDGRIDPDGQTIAALRQLKGAKGSASGAPTPAEHTKGGSGAGTSAHTGTGPEADYLTQNLNTYSDADTAKWKKWQAYMGTCNVTSLSMALTSLAGEDVVRSKVAALLARIGVPEGATCEIHGTRQAMSQVITNPDLVKQASLPDLVAAAAIMVGPKNKAWNKRLQDHGTLGQVASAAGLATATGMEKPLTDPKVREAAKELLDNGSRVVGTTPNHIVEIIDVLDDGVVIHDPAGARVSLSKPPDPFLYSTPKGMYEGTWLPALSTDDRRDTALRRAQKNPDIRRIVERLVEISKLPDKERRAGFTELSKQLPDFIAMGARNFYDLNDLEVYDARVAFSLSALK